MLLIMGIITVLMSSHRPQTNAEQRDTSACFPVSCVKKEKLNVYGNCLELERHRCPFLLSQRPHLTLGNLLTILLSGPEYRFQATEALF